MQNMVHGFIIICVLRKYTYGQLQTQTILWHSVYVEQTDPLVTHLHISCAGLCYSSNLLTFNHNIWGHWNDQYRVLAVFWSEMDLSSIKICSQPRTNTAIAQRENKKTTVHTENWKRCEHISILCITTFISYFFHHYFASKRIELQRVITTPIPYRFK